MSWKTAAICCTSRPLHVYNRGVDGMTIFRSDSDYAFCNELIIDALLKHQIQLLLYTLMPNHYHASTVQEQAYEVSRVMQQVWWKYARFFNRKYGRHGPLFSGRFRSKIVEDDAGLLRLSYYIHSNPVSAGLASEVSAWPYSSYREYMQGGNHGLVNPVPILKLVGGQEQYQRFLKEYNPNDPFSINSFLRNGGTQAC